MKVIALPWVDLECGGAPAPSELARTTERKPTAERCHRWVPTSDGVPRRFVCERCGSRCRRDDDGKIIAFARPGVHLEPVLQRELGVGVAG